MNKTERVVVLGGTGFVGAVLAERWPADATPPIYLVHRSRPGWIDRQAIKSVPVDLEDPSSVAGALGTGATIVNLLRPDGSGWYPKVIEMLAPLFARSGARRCVHASSIDVYQDTASPVVSEATEPSPRGAYEKDHLAAEAMLTCKFDKTVILRLGAVFGVGGRNVTALAREMASAPNLTLWVRRALYGERRMHLVSVETVCDALISAALSETLPYRLVLVTDDGAKENNFAFVQDALATAFGRSVPHAVPNIPRSVLRLLLRLRGLPIAGIDRRFSNERGRIFGVDPSAFPQRLHRYAQVLSQEIRA